jgi:PAS domain S-box-containing protein
MGKFQRPEHTFFEFLPGALIEVDLGQRLVVFMNRIALTLFKIEKSQLEKGLPLRDIFLNEEEYGRAVAVAEKFGLDSYQNRTAYTRFEKQDLYDFLMLRADGSAFYAECQGSFVLDKQSVPVAARIYIRDLTEHRLTEAALQENENKYRTLVEYSSDLIWLIDPHGYVLSVNSAVSRYLGKAKEEVEGAKVSDLFKGTTAETFQSYLNKIFISGKSATYETTMPTSNKAIWISTSITPVYDSSGNITALLGVSRDITDRKKSQDLLEKALINARNANQVKDQFIANISHEIRTPLTAITGFTERLRQVLKSRLSTEERDYFKVIANNSERLLRTMDAILNVSQLEAGAIQLSPAPLHLTQLIQLVCDKLTPLAQEKGLDLNFTSSVNNDHVVLDEDCIYQAIQNIIENAIKYTHRGWVKVDLKENAKALILTITDSGIGISDEYRENMFQFFSQESQGLTKHYQGIGLGLAITKRYLDMNGVNIKVLSKKGSGSTFKLNFPRPGKTDLK